MNRQQSLDHVQKYLEDILSFFEINLDVSVNLVDDVIQIDIPSSDDSSILIGRHAETLRALQYLVSNSLHSNNSELSRVNVDVADYKKQRAEKLAEQAREWIEAVRQTGDSHVAHLNAADRRVVHNVAAEYQDIKTFSEGEGRERAIIIAQHTS